MAGAPPPSSWERLAPPPAQVGDPAAILVNGVSPVALLRVVPGCTHTLHLASAASLSMLNFALSGSASLTLVRARAIAAGFNPGSHTRRTSHTARVGCHGATRGGAERGGEPRAAFATRVRVADWRCPCRWALRPSWAQSLVPPASPFRRLRSGAPIPAPPFPRTFSRAPLPTSPFPRPPSRAPVPTSPFPRLLSRASFPRPRPIAGHAVTTCRDPSTTFVPMLGQSCTDAVSQLHQSCTDAASELHQSCTDAASELHQSCTDAVSTSGLLCQSCAYDE